jgi:hypothetical protein
MVLISFFKDFYFLMPLGIHKPLNSYCKIFFKYEGLQVV